jgi:hypothetical protein
MNCESRFELAQQQLQAVRNERDEAKACHAAMREAYCRASIQNYQVAEERL